MISRKNIIIVICFVLFLLGISGYYFYVYKFKEIPQNNGQASIIDSGKDEEIKDDNSKYDISSKDGLSAALKQSGESEDFDNFAKYLLIVYKNLWENDDSFKKTESEIYMNVTTKYFDTGNINEALRISSIVYDQVSQGWRFRYLRVRCLEKLGRDAFNANDLTTAESYASRILQMMYRPEGANLMADIYIKKIEGNIALKDTVSAQSNLNFIWDYEVSSDRRARLTELKAELNK